MTRPLHAATASRLSSKDLGFAFLVYLDVLGDPLLAWSGFGELSYVGTNDTALNGKVFTGLQNPVEISSISEGAGGSDAVEVTLPGIDPFEPMMRQVITNRNRWQFRRAIIWGLALNPDTNAPDGEPFRLKTGRMDQAPFDDDTGIIKVKIEGQQSYGNQPLGTRYTEQRDINPNDTSQNWVHSLANMTAEMGKNSAANPGVLGGFAPGGSSGGGRGFFEAGLVKVF